MMKWLKTVLVLIGVGVVGSLSVNYLLEQDSQIRREMAGMSKQFGLYFGVLQDDLRRALGDFDPERARRSVVRVETPDGSCAGVLVSTNKVLSAAHCDNPDLEIIFHDGTKNKGKVIFLDAARDLMIIEVESFGNEYAPLRCELPKLGETVWIVGHPNGLYWSLSRGIISFVNRDLRAMGFGTFHIQTDALVWYGSSGGPMFDKDGNVIAIVNLRDPRSTFAFAVPSQVICDRV